MKTLTGVADCGLVPIPAWCEGHACPDMDDRQPAIEDANAALLAWYRHLVAERMALDEIVEQPVPPRTIRPRRAVCWASVGARALDKVRRSRWFSNFHRISR